MLADLEQGARQQHAQVDLFAAPPPEAAAGSPQASLLQTALQTALSELDPDSLSPRAALDALYQLKKLAG